PDDRATSRATARARAERLMWLAGGASMPQVRAIASQQLANLQGANMNGITPDDQPFRTLLSGDIKRFLERPMEPMRTPATFDAPPGAPIGDYPLDWLTPPSWRIGDWRM